MAYSPKKPQIFTGARAIVILNGKRVGLFANCSWSVRQDKAPAYILGRFNPTEITSTSQEPVQLSLTGYRVVGKGPYTLEVKALKDLLLNDNDFYVEILDRRTGDLIFRAEGCRCAGWSSGVAARGVSDIRLDVIGLVAWDESHAEAGDADPDAADLTN